MPLPRLLRRSQRARLVEPVQQRLEVPVDQPRHEGPDLEACIPYSKYEAAIIDLDDFGDPCDALIVGRGCLHASPASMAWATQNLNRTYGAERVQALVATGWPEALQQLVLEADMTADEVRSHVQAGTRPDAQQLEVVAVLSGRKCRCSHCQPDTD